MFRTLAAATAALAVLGAVAPAAAVVFTISGGGTVNYSYDDSGIYSPVKEDAYKGARWNMSITIETDNASTVDADPPYGAIYYGAHPQGALVRFTVAGIARSGFSGFSNFNAGVVDYLPTFSGEAWAFEALLADTAGSDADQQISAALHVYNFEHDIVPTGDLTQSFYYLVDDPADQTIANFMTFGVEGTAFFRLNLEWIALNWPVEVPEPAGLVALIAGLTGLAATRRRRR